MSKVWCESLEEPDFTEARIADGEWLNGYGLSFASGQPAPRPFPDTTVDVCSDPAPPDFFQPGSLFLVSDRLKVVLEQFGVRAEFFRVQVLHQGRECADRAYYFCNILDVVECLDLEHGEYTFWKKPGFTDHVDAIKKLAIDEGRASGHDLFRIAKGAEYIACVSDRVATEVQSQKLTGMRLVNPEDWCFGCG